MYSLKIKVVVVAAKFTGFSYVLLLLGVHEGGQGLKIGLLQLDGSTNPLDPVK